ncbi:hypothetical protein RHMOL_Rhmol08G0234600 [Rhododendron molle]|uniref:Uncharacterized protein n=1 Tax=Rhododendron molle TaxID=49168 RepID=A0ACC0MT41_RHOML|nr:hypothetical protein RHMOL_Rhmol08G0234600 [Rhododendron molle]
MRVKDYLEDDLRQARQLVSTLLKSAEEVEEKIEEAAERGELTELVLMVIWNCLDLARRDIMHFFSNPRKPMILALARPDPKKNITTLVKAFGECKPLRELANLTLIMGNRDAIDETSSTNASVLLSILKLIDKYDL